MAPVGMGRIFLLFFLCFCEGLRIPDENDYAKDVLKVNKMLHSKDDESYKFGCSAMCATA